jgi:HlyD family secretion protein
VPRKTRELKFEFERRARQQLAKQANWELARSKAMKLDRMIEHCKIYAQGNGVLIYANDSRFARRSAIEEGATVRERQQIFRIHDLKEPLRVNVKIPEVSVDQLDAGCRPECGSTLSRVCASTAR